MWEYIWPSGVGPRVGDAALLKIDPYPWSAPLEDVTLTRKGPGPSKRGSTERARVRHAAREDPDGPARAAGELQLPLALGLEAPVAQPLAPGLDRLANRVEVERVRAPLARPRHSV